MLHPSARLQPPRTPARDLQHQAVSAAHLEALDRWILDAIAERARAAAGLAGAERLQPADVVQEHSFTSAALNHAESLGLCPGDSAVVLVAIAALCRNARLRGQRAAQRTARAARLAEPCCARDTDGDGNCDRHPALRWSTTAAELQERGGRCRDQADAGAHSAVEAR